MFHDKHRTTWHGTTHRDDGLTAAARPAVSGDEALEDLLRTLRDERGFAFAQPVRSAGYVAERTVTETGTQIHGGPLRASMPGQSDERRLEKLAPTARRHTPPDAAYDAAGWWLAHQARARSSVQSLAPSTRASRRDSSRAV
jgi:hypothetical protein